MLGFEQHQKCMCSDNIAEHDCPQTCRRITESSNCNIALVAVELATSLTALNTRVTKMIEDMGMIIGGGKK